MRVLAISSAYGGATGAIVDDGMLVADGWLGEEHGLAAALPKLVARLLSQSPAEIALVAVVVGPGSFTGVRAGLSVAQGVGLGYGVPIIGVTVAEVFASQAAATSLAWLSGRPLWTAVHARPGRVFLDTLDGLHGFPTNALPAASKIAVCGNAANIVAATMAARGTDVMLTSLRVPQPVHVASTALARAEGRLPALLARPIYVDEAEAKLPRTGLRDNVVA